MSNNTTNYIELNNEVIVRDIHGKYQLHKDKEALSVYLSDSIDARTKKFNSTKEKIKYLVKENYYEESIINKYSLDFIEELYGFINSFSFEFQSFMSASKFYENYALKTDDGKYILENYEDKIMICSLAIANGNEDVARRVAEKLINQEFQPATPTFLNLGRKRAGELVSCFLITVEDSCEGISYAVASANHLSKIGGGVALNLTRLRARGESIKGIEGASGGVVGVAKMLEQSFSYFNQMGARQGAGAVYLNVLHADFDNLMDTKKINADERVRLATLSIGAIIPDKFMELAEKNTIGYAFYPHSIFKKYGLHLDDLNMEEWYDKLVDDPDVIKKEINPRQILTRIAATQMESGYPYIVFIDTANKQHTLKDVGMIRMSNLCCEIFQYQEPSDIKSFGSEESIWGQDISCNLGSLNISNVMENKKIDEAVETAIRFLTDVSDRTSIKEVPTVKRGNDRSHSVGLGAMNLHGYLIKNNIVYDSEEAVDFCNVFFAMMRYYAIRTSMYIAKEKNETFQGFEKSEYAKGKNSDVLGKYYREDFLPNTDKVKSLFDGIYIPTKNDWAKLLDEVKEAGIYNAYLMAIAPTQSISYVQNSTSSVMPITEQIEVRIYGDSTTIYPMPFLTNENMLFYRSAYNTDMLKVIDVVATVQAHVDQGISTTLFITDDKTTRDIARYYIYGYKKGLKSLYYTRTKMLRELNNECLSCSV
ncbi:class 1b ribonucleoside-diphosphate reductase subunit alpha [Peptostreptococcus canis]|uniref:Ribonucleoside-diphosphate reductase n=1 Tax=Peptostreptococcus canis TaxID=1159213 RepID=A0ABR6TJ90_9FIRM|nr:class 1b ribonucleoside-diphosphate reductase subunit alpha [Peptostreptococcus canis]MBC2575465.1 class 1b ribonucleoside-diphosphate reductase subunit alpha [Peptostreptococcus canis]MBP1997343.1 ribonucleoside-diphosphate reductase alpha chain [Peptostreptococcus canis]